MLTRLAIVALLFSPPVAAAETPLCDAATKANATCGCDVRTLRPLQGAVGMEEVRKKVSDIVKDPEGEARDLKDDPIKVIRGPEGALFITDHHHAADAWRLAGRPVALCQIGERPPFATEAQFWSDLVKDRLVRLADANGKPLTPAQLPPNLESMPDDPYRSLAWLVRKEDGFCRSEMQKEFAEFIWADWLRDRKELPVDAVRTSTKAQLSTALGLVRGPDAKAMPGYIGDKPAGFKCPKKS